MREDPTFLHSLLATSNALQQTHPALEHFEALNVYQIGTGQSMLSDKDRFAAPAKLLEQLGGLTLESRNELGTHEVILKYHMARRKPREA
jgi:hypothetical protein